MTPQRIQRKRTAGWRMPDNTVYVGRPTKWGNPATVGNLSVIVVGRKPGQPQSFGSRPPTVQDVAKWFADCVEDDPLRNLGWTVDEARLALGGKDLACWCPLGQPCHADVLLRVANLEVTG